MASRYYLYPDLSRFSRRTKIVRATLYLDRASDTWEQDDLYELHPVLNPWKEGSITWNNQPHFSKKYQLGEKGEQGIFSFDVTKFVKRQLKRGKYFGFVIKKPQESGDNFGLFATADYSLNGAENRPYLEITYKLRRNILR
jgi:hypothetical protein